MKVPLFVFLVIFGQLAQAMGQENLPTTNKIEFFRDVRDETIFEFFKIHIHVQKYTEQRAITQLRRAEQRRIYMRAAMCIVIVSCGVVLYTYFGWGN